jgi:hypothetical protein
LLTKAGSGAFAVAHRSTRQRLEEAKSFHKHVEFVN